MFFQLLIELSSINYNQNCAWQQNKKEKDKTLCPRDIQLRELTQWPLLFVSLNPSLLPLLDPAAWLKRQTDVHPATSQISHAMLSS